MRTTLTLDDDVATRLEAEGARTGASLERLVNEHLRRALSLGGGRKFVVEPRPLGLKPGLDRQSAGELLEQLEGPLHR